MVSLKGMDLIKYTLKKKASICFSIYSQCQRKLYLGHSHLQNPKISIPKEGHVPSWKEKRNQNRHCPPRLIGHPPQLEAPEGRSSRSGRAEGRSQSHPLGGGEGPTGARRLPSGDAGSASLCANPRTVGGAHRCNPPFPSHLQKTCMHT